MYKRYSLVSTDIEIILKYNFQLYRTNLLPSVLCSTSNNAKSSKRVIILGVVWYSSVVGRTWAKHQLHAIITVNILIIFELISTVEHRCACHYRSFEGSIGSTLHYTHANLLRER